MDWVEVTGKSVEEAREAALDQLGVDADEAEFEVLEEAKGGLFGLLRSEARVRARVAPTATRAKGERRERRGRNRPERSPYTGAPSDAPNRAVTSRPATDPGGGENPQLRENDRSNADQVGFADLPGVAVSSLKGAGPDNPRRAADPNGDSGLGVIQAAEGFLSGLVDAFGMVGEVGHTEIGEDSVEVTVAGEDLGLLIGPKGQTLSAVQELMRSSIQRNDQRAGIRLYADVAGYRRTRREALARFTEAAAQQVLQSGAPRALEPMPAADRKVIHDTVNEIAGVKTVSEGEEPTRHVVILVDEG